MSESPINQTVSKVATGIPGVDHICHGGIPQNRTTLVAGTAGSAKTVFSTQFLAEGIRKSKESGVFVTFEESPNDIRRNMLSLGWDMAQWESDGMFLFVDASADPSLEAVWSGQYDLGALVARIERAVTKTGAKRLVIDSVGAIFTQFADASIVRRELFKVVYALRQMGVTSLLTCERIEEYGEIGRYGVEEFVSDNVLILRHVLEDERRRRTIEILKFRGASHHKGEFPFTILPREGIVAIPLSAIELRQRSSDVRISSGNEELDEMCGGGFFRDSIILVSGATGTGKTLMVTEFLSEGARNNQRCLLFAFEESREQLFRNARGWGVDFEALETQGQLRVICVYPETASLEDHLVSMKGEIERFDPALVAVDSLSALERVSAMRGFREFVIGMTSFIKHKEVAGLFTSTTPTLMGGTSVTESHISTITDSIILLRYVELYGEMRRGLTVLKMRGSIHDKDIREFLIDGGGMHIGKPFRNVVGILAGHPHQIGAGEIERVEDMFVEDKSQQKIK